MADIQQNSGEGSGSATTVLVTVLIVVIIGLAFYFGFVRGNWGDRGNGGVDIDLTVPAGEPGGGPAY